MEMQALQRVQLELANFVNGEVRKRLLTNNTTPAAQPATELKSFKDSYDTLNHQLKTIVEKVLRSNYEAEKLQQQSSKPTTTINNARISHDFVKAAEKSPAFQPKVVLHRLNLGQLCKTYRINNLHILEDLKRQRGLVGPLSRTLGSRHLVRSRSKRRSTLPKKFEGFALTMLPDETGQSPPQDKREQQQQRSSSSKQLVSSQTKNNPSVFRTARTSTPPRGSKISSIDLTQSPMAVDLTEPDDPAMEVLLLTVPAKQATARNRVTVPDAKTKVAVQEAKIVKDKVIPVIRPLMAKLPGFSTPVMVVERIITPAPTQMGSRVTPVPILPKTVATTPVVTIAPKTVMSTGTTTTAVAVAPKTAVQTTPVKALPSIARQAAVNVSIAVGFYFSINEVR